MDAYLIYNPTSSNVVYDDDGRDIGAGEMLFAKGSKVLSLIEAGTLVQVQIPDKMPDAVRSEFYEQVHAALEAKREAAQQEAEVRNTSSENAPAEDDQNQEA